MWCFRGQAGCGGGKERSPLLNVKLFPTPTHITYIYVYESPTRETRTSAAWRLVMPNLSIGLCPVVYFTFVY